MKNKLYLEVECYVNTRWSVFSPCPIKTMKLPALGGHLLLQKVNNTSISTYQCIVKTLFEELYFGRLSCMSTHPVR